MKYQKGQSGNPKGKKKGTLNKFTTLKQSFLDAFQDKRIGGTEGLTEVFSKGDRRKIEFFKLISKMLPSNVGVEHSGSIKADLSIKDLKESIKNYEDGNDKQ